MFGVFASLDAIPLCLIDISESFTLETIVNETTDETIDVGDIASSMLSHIATASGRQRLADVIVHAVEKGYL